jgi:hypothetical protein
MGDFDPGLRFAPPQAMIFRPFRPKGQVATYNTKLRLDSRLRGNDKSLLADCNNFIQFHRTCRAANISPSTRAGRRRVKFLSPPSGALFVFVCTADLRRRLLSAAASLLKNGHVCCAPAKACRPSRAGNVMTREISVFSAPLRWVSKGNGPGVRRCP